MPSEPRPARPLSGIIEDRPVAMTAINEALAAETAISLTRNRSHVLTADGGRFVFTVNRGLVAVEVQVSHTRRRVMDFLLAGDVLTTGMLRGFGTVRLRAIDEASLVRQPWSVWAAGSAAPALMPCLEASALRAHVANAIIGLSDVDARVASFFLALATRQNDTANGDLSFELTMPREDVADYILVNPDTLSRSYSRLREMEILGRNARNHLTILNWNRLEELSPLADLIREALATP